MSIISAYVQCDYITVTAKTKAQCDGFEEIATSVLTDLVLKGHKVEPFKFYGYEGWRCYEMAYGTRWDGALFRVWGDSADELWRSLAIVAYNVTRFDICVDCLFSEPFMDAAKLAYELCTHSDTNKSHHLIVGSDGGQTFYLGSRMSERFARLYDKGVESKTFRQGDYWRYELELKGDSAYSTTRDILQLEFLDQVDAMAYLVYEFFDREGLMVAFPPAPRFAHSRIPKVALVGEELLQWLEKQVRPSVQRLIGLGLLDRVLDALGLDAV